MSISAIAQKSQTLQAAYIAPLKNVGLQNSLNPNNATNPDNAPKKSAADSVTISNEAIQLASHLKKA